MKRFLFFLLIAFGLNSQAQYIGVRARYTETRLVDNAPFAPSRENRLILSFYAVSPAGGWTPIVLSNYDIWIEKEGLQYGSEMGGVLDSSGNNYPGYSFTAPRVVAYYNTLGVNYFDCNPNYLTHYVVNGHELDCGFVRVSTWEWNESMGRENEFFNAPNVGLPYYDILHPYYFSPGNVNFSFPTAGTSVYNLYNFQCGGPQQLVMRGVLGMDSSNSEEPLPVLFANVRGEIRNPNTATIWWSNLTESDIVQYEIQKSVDGRPFVSVDTIAPKSNNGDRADYAYSTVQLEQQVQYRIRSVEGSGQVVYSTIIRLRLGDANGPAFNAPALSVYPNPVTNSQFVYNLSNAHKGRYISMVVSPDGRQLRQKLIMHNGGNLSGEVNLSGLPAGMYQFVIRGEQNQFTQKILYVR